MRKNSSFPTVHSSWHANNDINSFCTNPTRCRAEVMSLQTVSVLCFGPGYWMFPVIIFLNDPIISLRVPHGWGHTCPQPCTLFSLSIYTSFAWSKWYWKTDDNCCTTKMAIVFRQLSITPRFVGDYTNRARSAATRTRASSYKRWNGDLLWDEFLVPVAANIVKQM